MSKRRNGNKSMRLGLKIEISSEKKEDCIKALGKRKY